MRVSFCLESPFAGVFLAEIGLNKYGVTSSHVLYHVDYILSSAMRLLLGDPPEMFA